MIKKIKKVGILIILVLVFATCGIIIFNKKVMPIYLNYAEEKMKSVLTVVITKSITEDFVSDVDMDQLFIVKNQPDEKTMIVDFDPMVLNRMMANISSIVYDNLKKVGEKDESTLKKYNLDSNTFKIPSGIVFDTVLLNNLGPKIPINMEVLSMVNPNTKTNVTEYGINNSLIEVSIYVVASMKMILPTTSRDIQVSVQVPIAMKLIQGNVPEYYFGGLKNNS